MKKVFSVRRTSEVEVTLKVCFTGTRAFAESTVFLEYCSKNLKGSGVEPMTQVLSDRTLWIIVIVVSSHRSTSHPTVGGLHM